MITYLQNLNQWPNEFYIYKLENPKNENKNGLNKAFIKQSTTRCYLLFPEVFLKLSQTENTLDCLWIVWYGQCYSGQTAAYCLINSIQEVIISIFIK